MWTNPACFYVWAAFDPWGDDGKGNGSTPTASCEKDMFQFCGHVDQKAASDLIGEIDRNSLIKSESS